jgi:hypothetical protein
MTRWSPRIYDWACTGTHAHATPLAKTLLFPRSRPLCYMEPKFPAHVYVGQPKEENTMGKGLLLWLIGIPIPIILLIWLFGGLH